MNLSITERKFNHLEGRGRREGGSLTIYMLQIKGKRPYSSYMYQSENLKALGMIQALVPSQLFIRSLWRKRPGLHRLPPANSHPWPHRASAEPQARISASLGPPPSGAGPQQPPAFV